MTLASPKWINNELLYFNKTDYCPYMREGEGSTLGESRLKNTENRHFHFVFVIIQPFSLDQSLEILDKAGVSRSYPMGGEFSSVPDHQHDVAIFGVSSRLIFAFYRSN